MPTAQDVIEHFGLNPLPFEGGMWGQSYRSREILPLSATSGRYAGAKPMGTAIYYLLTDHPDSFSAMHRLRSDEVFHFYMGDPVEMLNLRGPIAETVTLGHDFENGETPVHVVARHTWQGCRLKPGGQWALMGTTMAPGYTDTDFVPGVRDELIRYYPRYAEIITALTRE
ncbi:MAG: cupin domain-containing protein [Chloroflexota bacterium]